MYYLIIVLMLFLGIGTSCAPQPPEVPAGQDVGTLAASWSEGTSDLPGLSQMLPGDEPLLIDTDEERDAFLARFDAVEVPDTEVEAVRAVDLSSTVIVAGGYARCQEFSAVVYDDSADPPALWFDVRTPDTQVNCAWAPYTVDVWQVPTSVFAGQVPTELTQPGADDDAAATTSVTGPISPPVAFPVGTLADSWTDADAEPLLLHELVAGQDSLLLADAAGRDSFLDSLPDELSEQADALRALDLSDASLVLVTYDDCLRHSTVYADSATPGRIWTTVARDSGVDDGTVCDAAPMTVDAWLVPIDSTGLQRPTELDTDPAQQSDD